MSLETDGIWKSGVWATTVWANGVWREGAFEGTGGGRRIYRIALKLGISLG